MADLRRPRRAPLTREQQSRLIRAVGAAAITAAVIYVLVIRLALPALAHRATDTQIAALRQTFEQHPWRVMSAVAGLAALLALPVLVVFRWVYGPLRSVESLQR